MNTFEISTNLGQEHSPFLANGCLPNSQRLANLNFLLAPWGTSHSRKKLSFAQLDKKFCPIPLSLSLSLSLKHTHNLFFALATIVLLSLISLSLSHRQKSPFLSFSSFA